MDSFAQNADGQNHDRLAHDGSLSLQAMLPTKDEGGGPDHVEITAVQKMLSATSGSFLTGLLGRIHQFFFRLSLPWDSKGKSCDTSLTRQNSHAP